MSLTETGVIPPLTQESRRMRTIYVVDRDPWDGTKYFFVDYERARECLVKLTNEGVLTRYLRGIDYSRSESLDKLYEQIAKKG